MSIEDRSTLVFASGIGRVKEEKPKAERPQGDGVVRIQLKRLGGGKMASVVTGIPLDEDALKELARTLKQKCGVGGSVKDFNILKTIYSLKAPFCYPGLNLLVFCSVFFHTGF